MGSVAQLCPLFALETEIRQVRAAKAETTNNLMSNPTQIPQPLRRFVSLLARQAAREVVAQQWMTTGTETTTAVHLPEPAPVAMSTST